MALTEVISLGIKDGEVKTADILDANVTTAKIAADAVTGAKIADDAIDSEHYTDGSIDTAHIAADQITGALIADDAVGAEHIEQLDNNLQFADSVHAKFGTDNDLAVYHDGNNANIINTTGDLYIEDSSGDIYIRAKASENSITCKDDGAVELYYDNGVKFETNTNGCLLGDDIKLQLGGNADLQIYHDGTNNEIRSNGAVDIYIRPKDTDVGIKVIADGAAELYHDNGKKLETTASGVTVSGSVTDDKGDVRKIVQNSQGGAYTLVATDAGKHILTANNITWADSVFAAGDAVTIVNNSGSNITITKGTNMYNASSADNANRTLAGRGVATLLFTAADTCYITGAGLS